MTIRRNLAVPANPPSVAHGAAALAYMDELREGMRAVVTTDGGGRSLPVAGALSAALALMERCSLVPGAGKTFFIGNGGSAAIASHVAIDYMKTGDFRTTCFTDAAMLTCFANDFGYERVYAEPVRRLASQADVLVAVSSSGRSRNILNAVAEAKQLQMPVITFSGFDEDNDLRPAGVLNFYVRSNNYRVVEAVHMALLDSMLQASVECRRGGKK